MSGGTYPAINFLLLMQYMTPYGQARSAWEIADGKIRIDVLVPANTTATLVLPSASGKTVTEKGIDISKVKAIQRDAPQGGDVVLKVGSGTYNLVYPWNR